MLKARTLGLKLEEKSPRRSKVLEEIKRLENQGYEFEAADASFELLVRKTLGAVPARSSSWSSTTSPSARTTSTARTPPRPRSSSRSTARPSTNVAEGDGPVNALDAALRKALVRFYPQLAQHEPRRLQGAHHRLAPAAPPPRPASSSKPATATPPGPPSASATTSSRPAGSPSATASIICWPETVVAVYDRCQRGNHGITKFRQISGISERMKVSLPSFSEIRSVCGGGL